MTERKWTNKMKNRNIKTSQTDIEKTY